MKQPKPLEVVSNEPIPITAGRAGRHWPFADMKIGDSFFVPLAMAGLGALVIRPAASTWARRHRDYFFTVRKVEGGYRVWRIEEPKKNGDE